jgi:hypothetical protein
LRNAFSNVKEFITKPFSDAFAWVSDKWESLKSAFGFGPEIKVPKPIAARAPIRARARGGL